MNSQNSLPEPDWEKRSRAVFAAAESLLDQYGLDPDDKVTPPDILSFHITAKRYLAHRIMDAIDYLSTHGSNA